MHVRLELLKPGGLLQNVGRLSLSDRVGRNIQNPAKLVSVEFHQACPVLRRLALGIEIYAQHDIVANSFADGVIVHIPPNPCSRQQQFAGVRRVDVVLFPDRPFHQKPSVVASRLGQWPDAVVVGGAADAWLILQELGEGMMSDTAPRDAPWPPLDRAHPSWLGPWGDIATTLSP